MMELSDVLDDDKDNHELYIVKLEYELDRVRQTYQLNESIWNEKEGTLNSIIAEQKQVISLLETLLKSNQQYYDDLQKNNLKKEETLQSISAEIEQTLSSTAQQIELLSKKVDEAELTLQERNAELQRYKDSASEKDAQISVYEKDIKTRDSQILEFKNKLNALNDDCINAREELARVSEQYNKVLVTLKDGQNQLIEAKRQRDSFKRARDHLQQTNDDLAKKNLEFQDVKNTVIEQTAQISDYEKKLTAKEAQVLDYESQLNQLVSDNARLQDEFANQKNTIERKLADSIRLYETGRVARNELSNHKAALEKNLAETVRLYESEKESRKELEKDAAWQSQELLRLKTEIDHQTREISALGDTRDENARLQQEIADLSPLVNRLMQEKQDLQNAAKAQTLEHKRILHQLADSKDRNSALESYMDQLKQEQYERFAKIESQLSSERETRSTIESEWKELNAKYERASVNLTGLFAREQRYKQNISALEEKVELEKEKAYQTISYQLGYALVQAGKSVSGFCRLPSQLLKIRKESRQRKAQLANKKALKRVDLPLISAPGSSTYSADAELVKNVNAETPREKLRVAAIMDEFTFHSYQPEANILQLHPESWEQQLTEFKPELLFVESAWNGLDGLWKTKISNADPAIIGIIDWCREHKVPSLFWNKEDPVHFSTFLPVASRVDVVFTTDVDCLPKYKEALGHDRVYLLPFAAQPLTHNPVEKYTRKDAFNFAGSYYLRYPERQRDFASLIETVKKLRPLDIYDRNFENPHPHYLFPEKYREYIIGSLPFDQIDKAYKGYRYGINMNTIKQSQTMFARRVFELLASNTIVVSNFSRGVRLMFGDLVVSSDNANEIEHRLKTICDDETGYRKLRLLGLRKVMKEHTYASRLQFIGQKVLGHPVTDRFPEVVVVARASTQSEFDLLRKNIDRQSYKKLRTVILGADDLRTNESRVSLVRDFEGLKAQLADVSANDYIAFFSNADYYGPNYILDLILANQYSDSNVFGKTSYYKLDGNSVTLDSDGTQYTTVDEIDARSSMIRRSVLTDAVLKQVIRDIDDYRYALSNILSLDEFNYCRNGTPNPNDITARCVNDLELSNMGMSLERDISAIASNIKVPVTSQQTSLPQISAAAISQRIPKSSNPSIQWNMKRGAFHIVSNLAADKYVYIYSRQIYPRAEMNLVLNSQFKLECDATCQLKTVFEFQDVNGKKIAHSMNAAGDFNSLAIPEHCTQIRFGFRVQGQGEATIKRLILGNYGQKPSAIVSTSPYLVLTKQYPDYDDLYKYGFLHTRLRSYKDLGLNVDVFRLTNEDGNTYREFEDIDVVSGDANLLDATLSTGQYSNVLVHLLDERMWAVLSKYLDTVRVTVWVHGAEIQVWQRRQFEFERMSADEVKRQKKLSDKRLKFWQSILKDPHPNLELVFVSEYFAREVSEDFSVDLGKVKYDIVHNYIDGEVFPYHQKTADHRRKLLSIRPYASRKYANDLTVKAILELSKRDFFHNLEIALYGDGDLFEQITSPLKGFANVKLHRRFLSHREIAVLHKDYGIFLTPTRMDSQGVSRDEAMSSGLVPITTNVTAIPEFVDESCGMLVNGEDYLAMANAVEELYYSPEKFLKLSKNAGERVRQQSGLGPTIMKEIQIITRDSAN